MGDEERIGVSDDQLAEAGEVLTGEVRKSAGWIVFLGVLTVLFGIFAITTPFITGLSVAILVGALVAVSGFFQIFYAFAVSGWKGKTAMILTGALTLIAGGLMMARPLFGIGVLTIILAVYLFSHGLMEVAFAFRLKPEPGWGWLCFSGMVSLVLGVLIIAKWPVSGALAIGILVGIRVLFFGWGMIFLGSAARSALPGEAAA